MGDPIETLHRICALAPSWEKWMHAPFRAGDFLAATDGVMILGIVRDEPAASPETATAVAAFLNEPPPNNALRTTAEALRKFAGPYDIPPCTVCSGKGHAYERDCTLCEGTGELDCPHCGTFDADCQRCDGTGRIESSEPVTCDLCDGDGKGRDFGDSTVGAASVRNTPFDRRRLAVLLEHVSGPCSVWTGTGSVNGAALHVAGDGWATVLMQIATQGIDMESIERFEEHADAH